MVSLLSMFIPPSITMALTHGAADSKGVRYFAGDMATSTVSKL
jgi:hypothetical protein